MVDFASPALSRALLSPAHVALVGASATAGKLTARPMEFLLRHGFPGTIHPVNPVRAEVLGHPAVPRVSDIDAPVDHAYILLDADPAIEALEDCARIGVKVVSLLADGFAEAGEEGRKKQQRLSAIAREAGMLLLGPNSMGVASPANRFICTTNAAFRVDSLLTGRHAVISQSGSLIGTILSRGRARGAGFSSLVSVGNEANAGVGDLGQILLHDPDTDGFLLFMETIRDPDALEAFSRAAAEQGKPVIAYMIGRSDEGQALSVSHTGALTGSKRAVAAFLKDIGIRQVDLFETLIDAPRTLSRLAPLGGRPKSVTVISTTGGGGAMVVDQISARGVTISGCGAAARDRLAGKGISLGHGKLVDVTLAGAKYETMKEVVSTLLTDPETGVLVVAIGSSAQFNPNLAVNPVVDALKEAGPGAAPVVAFPLPHAPESLEQLDAGGIPAFRSVEVCAETVALFLDADRKPGVRDRAPLEPAVCGRLDRAAPGTMDEVAAGSILEALGVRRPASIVLQPDEAPPEVLPFAYPVVAKLISRDLPHKTEAGAIRLNIPDRAALEVAISSMRDAAWHHCPGYSLSGIMVQESRSGLGEALVGVVRDALVGPVVTVGMGGILTEILQDTSIRPAPVSVTEARCMLDEVKGFALFRGFRGKPRGDLDALAEAVARISRIALHDRVTEAEVNPILIEGEGRGVVLLDALIHLA